MMLHKMIRLLCFIIFLNYCISHRIEKKSGTLYQSANLAQVDFQKLNRDVFDVQNRLRTNPQSFIPKLQQRLNYFEGSVYAPPGKYRLGTSEGPAAVQDAIKALQNQRPLYPFVWGQEVAQAAEEHSKDMAAKDMDGTTGSDGSSYQSRLQKQCDVWQVRELTNTLDVDAEDVVLSLYICDGLASRDCRSTIFSTQISDAAVSCVSHPSNTAFCTLDYTSGCKSQQDYLKLAWDVYEAQNTWRSNPQSFIPLVQEQLRYLQDDKSVAIPGTISISTQEGDVPLKESLQALQDLKPLPTLKWNQQVSRASQDHGNDMNKKNFTEHAGSDGSSPHSRINRYCTTDASGENLAFGSFTGKDVILSLFVDDGVPARGHRQLLIDRSFTGVGVGCAPHPQYRVSCTLNYIIGECQNKGFLEIVSSTY